MNASKIYHGGGKGKPFPFSVQGTGGAVTGPQFTTLILNNAAEIDSGVEILAPATNLYSDERQGYFLKEDHILRELHLLYNRFFTSNNTQTTTVNFRRRLADGSLPGFISVYTQVTTFPDSGFGWDYYFGDQNLNMNIVIPAGYYLYGYCTGKTTVDTEGLSVWALLEKA